MNMQTPMVGFGGWQLDPTVLAAAERGYPLYAIPPQHAWARSPMMINGPYHAPMGVLGPPWHTDVIPVIPSRHVDAYRAQLEQALSSRGAMPWIRERVSLRTRCGLVVVQAGLVALRLGRRLLASQTVS
jgi:hypothetical protein